MTARGFADLDKRLDVRDRVEKLEKQMTKVSSPSTSGSSLLPFPLPLSKSGLLHFYCEQAVSDGKVIRPQSRVPVCG